MPQSKDAVRPGAVIHQYGLQFAARSPALALEYYMLAAKALGDDNTVRARLVRELLTQSNAFGFLLGSGGSRGGAHSSPVLRKSDCCEGRTVLNAGKSCNQIEGCSVDCT